MGLVSRGHTRAVAGLGVAALAVALLLTGCSSDTPEGGTIDETTPVETSTPTPTPTPTPTTSDREQKAVDAAIDAYKSWETVSTRLLQGPQKYTGSQVRTELYKVGGDPLARQIIDVLVTFTNLGTAQQGERKIERLTAEGVKLDVPKGQYPEVLLRVCADLGELADVNVKTGKVVTPAEPGRKTVQHAKVWLYDEAWHVVELNSRSGEKEKC